VRLTLDQRVADRLSSRLEAHVRHPVALALSGGGDSVALLHLAAGWARAHGRRLLALTVDHGLNADSARWSAFAERTAREAGADWLGLAWTGPKPATGLSAAARMARHRLIADAARDAGARVVLFAHTADDIAEGEVMRAEGSTLGRLRDWAPSPAWPEGRGLMLLRPLLDVRRAALRDWLQGRGAGWIDDPANEDMRYARSRARQMLNRLPKGEGGTRPARAEWEDEGLRRQGAQPPKPLTLSRQDDSYAAVRSSPPPLGEGTLKLDRAVDGFTLAATLVCVGGGDRLPRGDRLTDVMARLQSGEAFIATLCGARVEALDDQVIVMREAGEFRRRPPPPLQLAPGVETVWDGRWAIRVDEPGWAVVPVAGRMATLAEADRAILRALPAPARGAVPVLIRNDPGAAVLAGTGAKARSLVGERLALALDRMTHEKDLAPRNDGAKPWNHLFSSADITGQRAP
jgi:tRNA(Ile)-lysidine synthase